MEESLEMGQIVTGIYKTGKYIGEITNVRPTQYVVRVLAVLKHPDQGDLHNPKEVDVAFFHERRALAFREQTNIPKAYVKPYDGDIPAYEESLKSALEQQYTKLKSVEVSGQKNRWKCSIRWKKTILNKGLLFSKLNELQKSQAVSWLSSKKQILYSIEKSVNKKQTGFIASSTRCGC